MKTLGGILMGIGFLVMIGSAGTSDHQTMVPPYTMTVPTWEIFLIAAVGLGLFALGACLLKENSKDSEEKSCGVGCDYRSPDAIRGYNNRE